MDRYDDRRRPRPVRRRALNGSALEGLRVLVIEDDFYLATDTQAALEQAGADVLGPCPDAASALDIIVRQSPDCAILDVNLGAGPTFETAEALRSWRIPFLFVTGYDAEFIPPRFRNIEHLEKPINAEGLVSALSRMFVGLA
jgi:DNA-binding response OmpR family regulator